jgi:hypothetical protein
MQTWYAFLPERCGAANYECFNSALAVAQYSGAKGYQQAQLGYTRTDTARNNLLKKFLEGSDRDDDLMVMLDCDHKYPPNIVERFAAHPAAIEGVVGALAFRRSEPYDPLFFIRDDKQVLRGVADVTELKSQTVRCAIVSTSAIAIRRWVLVELARFGVEWPWFKYEYPTGGAIPSEDMYFGRICEQAGIWHYVDTSLIIPHSTIGWVDDHVQAEYLKARPQLIAPEPVNVR